MSFFKLIILANLILISGCASILGEDKVTINVIPTSGDKIDITVQGTEYTVPGLVSVARSDENLFITTSDDRCANQTIVRSKVDPLFYANILFLYGATTDYALDSMWTYDDVVVIHCVR